MFKINSVQFPTINTLPVLKIIKEISLSLPHKCNKKGSGSGVGQCKEISFMIFRTGSVLIVGNCTEFILNIIYAFLKKILKNEYQKIYIENTSTPIAKKKTKRIRKKKIFIERIAD